MILIQLPKIGKEYLSFFMILSIILDILRDKHFMFLNLLIIIRILSPSFKSFTDTSTLLPKIVKSYCLYNHQVNNNN